MTTETSTVSLRKVALELLDEEMKQDKEFERLQVLYEENKASKKEKEQYDELFKKYTEANYYRNIQRYTEQIIQFNRDFVKEDGRDEYFIDGDQEWLLKVFLREYMRPFSKKSRSKRLTQLTFEEFDNFVQSIERAIQEAFPDNEEERQYQLHLLNLYTNYKTRRAVFATKQEIERLVSEGMASTKGIQNFHARLQFLEEYRKDMKRLTEHFKNEVHLHLEAEEALLNDMTDEDILLTKGLYTKEEEDALKEAFDQDVHQSRFGYSEMDIRDILRMPITEDEKTRLQEKLEQWQKIIRAEYE